MPSLKTKETRKDFILDLFVAKNLENTIYCQRKIISHYIKRWENISFLCTMAGQKKYFLCLFVKVYTFKLCGPEPIFDSVSNSHLRFYIEFSLKIFFNQESRIHLCSMYSEFQSTLFDFRKFWYLPIFNYPSKFRFKSQQRLFSLQIILSSWMSILSTCFQKSLWIGNYSKNFFCWDFKIKFGE